MAGSAIRGSGGNQNVRRVRRAAIAALAVLATVPFVDSARAAGPKATLEQCENGPAATPTTCDWITGNLGPHNSHWAENDSVPYRLKLDNLATTGTHTVTIEWDPTKAGKHAFDYLTTFNRTETTADPCNGVAGCTLATSSTTGIPADPDVTAATVPQIAGLFTIWNGAFTSVSGYTRSGLYTGDSSTRITLTFTAATANPVISWSGHIADDVDWGPNSAASTISGSPYHMRLIEIDGFGGNQDRSMKVAPGPVPSSITIVKQASHEGARQFSFAASDGLGTFTLVDDGDDASAPFNSMTFDGLTDFYSNTATTPNTYDFTETVPNGWDLTSITCTGAVYTPNLATGSVSVRLTENTQVTCTFGNTDTVPTIDVSKTPTPTTVDELGGPVTFGVTVTNNSTDESVTLQSLNDAPYGNVASGTNPNIVSTGCSVPQTIAPSDDYTCSFVANVTGNAGDTPDDTVTASVLDEEGNTITGNATATVTVRDVLPSITVSKVATPTTVPEPGGRVTFGVVVTNTSVESVTLDSLLDNVYGDLSSGTNLNLVATTCAVGSSIPAGDDYTCSFTVDIVGKSGDTETDTVEAEVHDDENNFVKATDSATVTVTDPPPVIDSHIAIDKSADPKSASPGDRVVYTYLVTNPGNAALTQVVVTDDKCAPVTFVSGDTDGDSALDPGETWRYTCAVTVGATAGSLTNVGTVTAKDPTGATVSANDTETITVVLGVVIEQPRAAAAEEVGLPRTGQDIGAMTMVGAALVALGSVLLACAPRRRRTS